MAGIFDWMADNPKSLEGIGSLLGGAGGLYGGFMQQYNAKKMLNLQQDAYAFNKDQILKDEEDRKKAALAFQGMGAAPLVSLSGGAA